MADQNARNVLVRWNFSDRWLRIRAKHSKIQNVASNMADKIAKSYLIGPPYCIRHFDFLNFELWPQKPHNIKF